MDTFYLAGQQKHRRRLISKIKIYIGVVLFIALLIGISYLVIYSRVFKIKGIAVVQLNQNNFNIGRVGDADLQNSLLQDLKSFYANNSEISYFLGPDNILSWNTNKLPNSDLFWKKYAAISQIRIKKNYFKRTIEVDYTKRERYGVWCLFGQTTSANPKSASSSISVVVSSTAAIAAPMNERCFWFDDEGIVFSQTPHIEGSLIYRIYDYTGRGLSLGDAVLNNRLLPNLFKIFNFLDQFNFNVRSLRLDDLALEEISANQVASATPQVYFSLRFDPAFALQPLQQLKSTLGNIRYIDLRVENRIYYK